MGKSSAMTGCILFISLMLATASAVVNDSNLVKPPLPCLCPKNEEHRCQLPCPPNECIILYAAFRCIENQTCVEGCYCKKGYLRIGKKGPCVPRDQCNPLECVNDPNAQRGCGDRCGKTCEDYEDKSKVCPKAPCKKNGCDCKYGHVYDTNLSLCVKPKDCTKPCRPNERYSTCLLGECEPRTCEDLGKPLACPAIAAPCLGGCICDYGYVKDKNGTCIDAKKCTSCGGDPNAHIGCGNPCGKTCADRYANKSDLICPQYCKSNGCDCKEGYLLNTDAKPPKCVLAEKCPKPAVKCTKPNEKYIDCLQGQCKPKTCDELKTPKPCPRLRPPCPGGCICFEGFVRNATGDCIKEEYCPKQCTKPHERYSNCLLGECVPKTCDDLGKPLPCPDIAPPCAGGCICEAGYVKDKDGNCIDAKTCPKCGDDLNAQTGCGNPCGKTCASRYANKSDLICPQYCEINGCDCKKGYLLNTDAKPPRCVLAEKCPIPTPQCKKNEEFYCGPSCPDSEPSCANPKPWACLNKKCQLKCFCKKGFVRGANNTCVAADQCPKQCTKPHERYSNCLLGECVAKTCDDLGKPLQCPDKAPPCAGGCICEAGYVKDKDGNCIDAKMCSSCGGDPHATSGCGNPCGRTCASIRSRKSRSTSAVACATYCKVNGCDCKQGYVLNTDLKPPRCVLPEDCDKPINCTKPHERYIECLSGQCNPKYCDDLDRPISCPFTRGPCPGGCICEEGYLRNSTGYCIKQENCPPKTCRANQTWTSPCNAPCPYPNCPRNDQPQRPCEPLLPCYPGCQCKLNYLRNSTGHCILAPECPPVNCTRQNEIWGPCPSACLAESCDDVNKQPITCNTLIWLCSPRCVCKKGHFRNKDGLCVPASQCPTVKCTKPYEQYTDCLPGQCKPKTCDELITPAPCPKVRPPCPGGCICVDGYVRNPVGDCIKIENCPKTCSRPNEQYTDCTKAQCCPKTCKGVVKLPTCPKANPGPCSGGCICKKGFVKSDNGTCIAISDCPKAGTCIDPNQEWVQCAASCGNAFCPENDQPQLPCFLPRSACFPGCKCKTNYRIDKNNKCIPARNCPAVPCTRRNEEYNPCPGNRITTCELFCSNSTQLSSTDPKVCYPACTCKKGYYKNANGTCVSDCQCPSATSPIRNETDDNIVPGSKPVETVPRQCPPNEVLKSKPPCPPDTCNMLYVSVLCIANQTESIVCTCKDGYLRTNSTASGVCVPQDRCLPPECANDPNAIRGCGNRCGKTCADFNNTNIVCKEEYCNLYGCECKDGYVYDKNVNTCVNPKQCTKQCTKPHERYSTCLLGECVPKTCSQLGYPIACPRIIGPCAGGCICEEGYVKDSNGDCIEKKKCPSCRGDPYAVSGCGNPCGKTCDSLYTNSSDLVCPQYCEINGCDCKPGYRLLIEDSTGSKKCVPEKKCPKPTNQCKGPHEKYIDCPAGQCNLKTCDDLKTSPGCPRVIPPCPGGCVCVEGYLRYSNGTCIKKEHCPANQCKGPHEIYIDCPAGQCNPKTCDDLVKPFGCPRIIPPCPGGCVCKEGYLKDSNGTCIKKEHCPSTQCKKPNERYSNCLIGECVPKTCNDVGYPVACPGIIGPCAGGCTCIEGFVKDSNGNCIDMKKCPSCRGDGNAVSGCGNPCGKTCANLYANNSDLVCPQYCEYNGCDCKPGYRLLNANNTESKKCIPERECPKPSVCKDPNASWTDCKDACPATCQNTRPNCVNIKCSPGCQCNKGYVLSKVGGKCVKIETCGDYAKCGTNQTFVPCTFKCPQVMCPRSDQTLLCKPPRDCPGGCGCKPYYRYNATGDCVKSSDCPPVKCTRLNEQWACQGISDWERCEDRYNSPPFNPGHPDDCTPKCVCTQGFWRNDANKCVPEDQCPPINR